MNGFEVMRNKLNTFPSIGVYSRTKGLRVFGYAVNMMAATPVPLASLLKNLYDRGLV